MELKCLPQGHTPSYLVTGPEKTESRFSDSQTKTKRTLMWLEYKKARQGKDNPINTCQKLISKEAGRRASLKKKMIEVLKCFKIYSGGLWPAQSEAHTTLDLGLVSLSPALSVEIT